MNTQDVGFFILSDEDLVSTSEYAVIRIDHEVMVSIMYDMYHTFGPNEKEFFNWYKDEYLLKKICIPISFIINPIILEKYNQDKVCEEILNFLRAPENK